MTSAKHTTCTRRHRRLTERLFVRGLSAGTWQSLRAHIAECVSCRQHFDLLAQAERALAGGDVLSPEARDRIAERLVEGSSSSRRPWLWGGVGLATAAAAMVVVMMLGPEKKAHEFRKRGDTDRKHRLVPGERNPGLRLFCITPTSGSGVVADETRATEVTMPVKPLRCILDGELQLAYSTPRLKGLTMIVFARDDDDQVFWYAPSAPGQSTVPLSANIVDEPLAWSTKLAVNHRPGRYKITVRFFKGKRDVDQAVTGPAVYELHSELEVTNQGSQP